jgi:hypothetical protein
MAVPSSGELKLRADIALEVDGDATGTNVSLGTLSNDAGFTEPDNMSEFYGYSSVTAPSVSTEAASSVTASSMQLNGNVTAENGATVTDRGFYFGTDSNYANNTKTSAGSGLGTYNLSQTSLTHSTTYYITAYAVNSAGEGVGVTIGQATNVAAAPTVTANPSFSSVGVSSMTTSASYSNPDGLSVTYKVYFGTSSNYASNTLYTITTNTNTSYSPSKNFTGLNASTTYYARFVAQASGYSDVQTTTTSQATPALATYGNAGSGNVTMAVYTPDNYNSQWNCLFPGGSSCTSNPSGHYLDIRMAGQYNHANYGWTNQFYYRTYSTFFNGTWSGSSNNGTIPVYSIQRRTDQSQLTTSRTYFYHYVTRQQYDNQNYIYSSSKGIIYRMYRQSMSQIIQGVDISSSANGYTQAAQTCGFTHEWRIFNPWNYKVVYAYNCNANYGAVFGSTWTSGIYIP